MTDLEKHMIGEALKDLKLANKVRPRLVSRLMIKEAMGKLEFVLFKLD